VSIGRVGRPHGLDGSFHVTRPGEFIAGGTVWVDGAPRTIDRLAGTRDKPIVRLAGCTSREHAEALRGLALEVVRDETLAEDEFWASDLAGCVVVDGDREVGVVARMIALPSCEALEVTRDGAGELLVPLVRDAVRSVDVAAGVVDVDLAFLGEGAAEPAASDARRG
jgi:16S rRNA processing protein RimM